MLVITYDYETYWRSKDYTLSKMSPIEYIRHPDFYAQMLGISVNGGPVAVVEHDDIPAALAALELHKPDRLVVGHNGAGFDHLITSEVYGIHPALPTDTIHMMRWTGVSRLVREQLASMTHWFGTGEKRAGTVISDGKRTKADFTPEAWEDFKRYCAEDVQQTAACAAQMLPHMTADALLFSCITSRMATEPVFYINPKPLAQFIADHDERTERTRRELQALFHFANQAEFLKAIRSESTFCATLEQLGSAAPLKVSVAKTATAKAKLEAALETETDPTERAKIEAKLSNPASYEVMTPALAKQDLAFMDMLDDPDDRVRQLVQARMEHNSSVPRTRAMSLLKLGIDDKPLPVLLKCFYAHTSRYGAGTTEGKSDGANLGR